MKIIRFQWKQAEKYGILEGDNVMALEGNILVNSKREETMSIERREITGAGKTNIVVGLGVTTSSLLAVRQEHHTKPESFFNAAVGRYRTYGQSIIYPR